MYTSEQHETVRAIIGEYLVATGREKRNPEPPGLDPAEIKLTDIGQAEREILADMDSFSDWFSAESGGASDVGALMFEALIDKHPTAKAKAVDEIKRRYLDARKRDVFRRADEIAQSREDDAREGIHDAC